MLDQWLNTTLARINALPTAPESVMPPAKLHTFYGGAQLFHGDTFRRLKKIAQAGLDTFFPTPDHLAQWYTRVVALLPEEPQKEGLLWLPTVVEASVSQQVHRSLISRLETMFIEDYRIDFEDGFGVHSDEKSYAQARRTAKVLGQILLSESGAKLPEMGIRLKPLSPHWRVHAIQVLFEFMQTLSGELGDELAAGLGRLPRFWVTIPKCEQAQEVHVMLEALSALEASLGLPADTFGLEIMLESRTAVMALGQESFLNNWLPHRMDGAKGRETALVMGTYDTCADWGIISAAQGHEHPLLDSVRLQATGWGRQVGVPVIDSITRAVPSLSGNEVPLLLHARHVLHSLSMGIATGWDIHPLQALARHAVVLMVLGISLPEVITRLRAFEAAHSHASRVGAGFDDLATVRGLCAQVSQALQLGLLTPQRLEAECVSWPPSWVAQN